MNPSKGGQAQSRKEKEKKYIHELH